MEEKVKVFLKELEELTNKHGMYLSSCGCCQSIRVGEVGTDNELADYLSYDEKENKYTCNIYDKLNNWKMVTLSSK
jgi:hypothetical protein